MVFYHSNSHCQKENSFYCVNIWNTHSVL